MNPFIHKPNARVQKKFYYVQIQIWKPLNDWINLHKASHTINTKGKPMHEQTQDNGRVEIASAYIISTP